MDEQHIDPWSVKGGKKGFDYLKLLNQFGTRPITPELIKRIELLTNMRVHRFLRRGIFFSQQDLEKMLDHYESGKPVFLYTGRGPSSESMHLGHMIPFEFTSYLQKAFQCILVVQMSDDEKFYFKGGELDNYRRLSQENAKDIIACDFDPERTYIFSNFDEIANGNPGLWRNVVEMQSYAKVNQIRAMFGLNELGLKIVDNETKPTASPCSVGMMSWPVYQSVPCLSSSFERIFGSNVNNDNEIFCFVPMAVDQAPYFRLMNDYCGFKKCLKPAQIHSEFLISLEGRDSKMSSSEGMPPIYLTDDTKTIVKKINKCFSGGKDTLKQHMEEGADLTIDVPYQWLIIFMEDDDELEKIAMNYGPYANNEQNDGVRMKTSEVKKIMCDCILNYVANHQERRKRVTSDVLNTFFNPNRKFNLEKKEREPIKLLTDEEYEKQGANFDRYFGLYK
jgi:tryptophanyl-tRNA synthetase